VFGAQSALLICVELFVIIGADACDFSSSGDTVVVGSDRRAHRERVVLKFSAALIMSSSGLMVAALHSFTDN
jgi:hypothetical protein